MCTFRNSILKKIKEKGKLTPHLKHKIERAKDLTTLNDIWMPFREKRCTRADEARKLGLEPVARRIFQNPWSFSTNPTQLKTQTQGIRDLLAEMFSECGEVRRVLREFVNRYAAFHTSLKKTKTKTTTSTTTTKQNNKTGVYDMYDSWTCSLCRMKGYHLMALERGAREKCINVTVKIDAPCVRHAKTVKDGMKYLNRKIVCMMRDAARNSKGNNHKPSNGVIDRALCDAAEDSWKRLIRPSLVREARKKLRERAHNEAIECFASNVESLLLQPPRRGYRVLGVDPGFRMGCKLAVCDEQGVMLDSGVLYLHRRDQAVRMLIEMTRKHRVNMIAIGNGKASREMEKLIGSLDELCVSYVVVSEAGASVYVVVSIFSLSLTRVSNHPTTTDTRPRNLHRKNLQTPRSPMFSLLEQYPSRDVFRIPSQNL